MKKLGFTVLSALLGSSLAFGGVGVTGYKYADTSVNDGNQHVTYPGSHAAASGVDFTEAAAAVTPAVVFIRVTLGGQGNEDDGSPGVQMASGSGVIISPDGYIATNNHVVENATKIEVTTNDHRDFIARVIGRDPNTDLALIKVNATDLPVVKLGNSDDVKVGEWVLAVGNPFDLTSTVTAGIVSAKGRGIGIIGHQEEQENPFGPASEREPRINTGIESFIQTDAAINPGNSGGALVNTKGELIGINSAIASHTGSYEGYGFAIPVNLAKKVLGDIEKYGSVKRGYVGVSFQELNSDAASALHIDRTAGLYVNQVAPGSGAAAAGLLHGDIITKVNGKTVYESSDLEEPVARLHPGDTIDLTVLRNNEEKKVQVTLAANAGNLSTATAANVSSDELYNKLGADFAPLSADQKTQFNTNSGAMVTRVNPGQMFDEIQIPVGSVITSVNKQQVNSAQDIAGAISNLIHGKLIVSGYYPDGSRFNNVFEQGNGDQ